MNDIDAARWLVVAAIAITVVEAAVLVARGRALRAAGAMRAILANIGAGLCLQLALLAALAGTGAAPIALGLLAAGVCHACDLMLRLADVRATRSSSTPTRAEHDSR